LPKSAKFTQSLLAMTVWRDYEPGEQRLFLSLMQSCAITFLHRDEDERLGLEPEYLAPDMLPEKAAMTRELDGRWDEQERAWRVEYEYPFLHHGLMRSVLCDVGARSKDAGVYWRYGLWVYDQASRSRALLEQRMATDDGQRGRIVLRLQGTKDAELGRWLCDVIETRSRQFGYAALRPTIDELPSRDTRSDAHAPGRHRSARVATNDDEDRLGSAAAPAGVEAAPSSAATPRFARLDPSDFPARDPEVFVSYAWGDNTEEGRRRGDLVDQLCAGLRGQGITMRRDRDEMQPGNLISEFMDRLAEGDYIVAVISDKYLRSEYCMYELFRIYRNCADRPERFLAKVIPLILPDASLGTLPSRLSRAIHWCDEERALEPLVQARIDAVGTEVFRKFKLIGEFARNTSDMLELLVDKLQPRDFERQAQEGFREVVAQIRAKRKPAK
jgi:internalin A